MLFPSHLCLTFYSGIDGIQDSHLHQASGLPLSYASSPIFLFKMLRPTLFSPSYHLFPKNLTTECIISKETTLSILHPLYPPTHHILSSASPDFFFNAILEIGEMTQWVQCSHESGPKFQSPIPTQNQGCSAHLQPQC